MFCGMYAIHHNVLRSTERPSHEVKKNSSLEGRYRKMCLYLTLPPFQSERIPWMHSAMLLTVSWALNSRALLRLYGDL